MSNENAMVLAAGQTEEGDAMLVFMEKAGRTFDMLINSGTSLLPSNIQSVGDCVIASAFGRRFGMDPMASIYNIHIIEGRPQLRADAIVGLCKARREVCKYFMLVESSGLIATYETHRVGEPAPTRMSFTYAEAEAADLTKPTKTGKPSNWKRFPAAMCRARAGVALARAVYPDIVGGIYYPGELNDDDGFVGVEGVPDVMVPAQKAQRTPPAVIDGVRPAATLQRVHHPLERPAIAEPFDDAEVDDGQVDDPIKQRLYILAESIDPEGSPWSEVAVLWYLASRPQAPASSPTLAACLDKLRVSDAAWAKTAAGMVPALQRRMAIVGGLDGARKWLRALPAGCVAEVKASAASDRHAQASTAGTPGALLGIALAVAEESTEGRIDD